MGTKDFPMHNSNGDLIGCVTRVSARHWTGVFIIPRVPNKQFDRKWKAVNYVHSKYAIWTNGTFEAGRLR